MLVLDGREEGVGIVAAVAVAAVVALAVVFIYPCLEGEGSRKAL